MHGMSYLRGWRPFSNSVNRMRLGCASLSKASVSRSSTGTRSVFQIPQRDDRLLLGCVSYDPAVGDIWNQMKTHLRNNGGLPTFDYVLFTNYEQQVAALCQNFIDIAWNGPIAHVLSESQADIVSLGMRDVDCDFESIVVTRKSNEKLRSESQNTNPTIRQLLAGASDSPQAYVIPQFVLRDHSYQLIPHDFDIGKHGDTAVGEVRALEALTRDDFHHGAVVSRMMWEKALNGLLPTVDGTKLNSLYEINGTIQLPKFDHCQFDALESNLTKVEPFYHALHAMDMNDPHQEPVMKLEGLRKRWSPPRQDGYDIVRSALGLPITTRRAKNFVPSFTTASTTGVIRAYSSNTGGSNTRQFSSTTTTSIPQTKPVTLQPGSRVGVIGCGVAGLQVIRSMRARGYNVTAFDKADDVGGLWRQNYDNYALQVGKQFYEMPDLKMTEAEWQELTSGPKVQTYIKRFAAKFELEPHIQLNTAIEKVVCKPDGTWSFVTNAGEKNYTFDYCVVATGMYSSIPFVPETPGRDTYSGSVIHSSQFLDATMAKDKRVVVVGGGKSATDCSTSAATKGGATSVTLIQRNAHWPTPLYIAGLIPFQHVFLSRLGQALVEAKVGVYPGSKSFAALFRPIMGPIFAIVEALFAFQLGLKGDLRPKSGVVEDFYGYAQVQDATFKNVRDSGKVKVKLGTIASFTKTGVKMTNGEEMGADMVLYATGFGKDYAKLFESDVLDRLDVQKDGLNLYKRILPPDIPGLAFVGCECATIFNCTNSGLQAEWLARTLAGQTKQDLSPNAMKKEAHAFQDFARSWMPETSSRKALVLLHQLHYYDQLLSDMGENPSRKENVIAEYLGSYYSADYDNIVGRPSRV